MNIRIAEKKDLAQITEIYNQAIRAGEKTANTEEFTVEQRMRWFNDHPENKYPIIVSESNGVITGYASFSAYRTGRAALRYTAEISYYVHSDHFCQGIASALIEHILKKCVLCNIKTVFAIIVESNTASVHLMKKFGFEQWGYMPDVAIFNDAWFGHFYFGKRIAV